MPVVKLDIATYHSFSKLIEGTLISEKYKGCIYAVLLLDAPARPFLAPMQLLSAKLQTAAVVLEPPPNYQLGSKGEHLTHVDSHHG